MDGRCSTKCVGDGFIAHGIVKTNAPVKRRKKQTSKAAADASFLANMARGLHSVAKTFGEPEQGDAQIVDLQRDA